MVMIKLVMVSASQPLSHIQAHGGDILLILMEAVMKKPRT